METFKAKPPDLRQTAGEEVKGRHAHSTSRALSQVYLAVIGRREGARVLTPSGIRSSSTQRDVDARCKSRLVERHSTDADTPYGWDILPGQDGLRTHSVG